MFEDGVDGAPTLLHNVETLAHLALIARHGPDWYRSGGATTLFTVHRGDAAPAVVEASPGISLEQLAGAGVADAQAVLVGGYHGSWLPSASASGSAQDTDADGRVSPATPVTAEGLGVPLGAGMIAVLPQDRCGIVETAAIPRFLALESAGQCGPCLNGLPRIAAAFGTLARPAPQADLARVRENLSRWAHLVTGRGACRHPDGSARRYRDQHLAEARHQPDLVPESVIHLHTDHAVQGVGSAAVGPGVLPQHRLTVRPAEFALTLRPVPGDG